MADEAPDRQEMIRNLRQANFLIITRLNSLNVEVTNIGVEKHEFFIKFLVDMGFISEAMLETFELKWESQLNDTLQKQEIKVREMLAAKGISSKPKGLIIPGRNPIL